MTALSNYIPSFSNAWGVLTLFVIPWGGGIPAGVLLARDHGIVWPITLLLYLVSDLILAFVFEPILLAFVAYGKSNKSAGRVGLAFKKALEKTTITPNKNAGPFALIALAFGADPMTGRAAARMAGHGFVSGWTLAITGDMIFFAVLMASTLWLDGILGNGTQTTLIVLAGMFVIPWAVRKVRGQRAIRR